MDNDQTIDQTIEQTDEQTDEQPDEKVHLDIARGVATITLDSPANRNALSGQLVAELEAHLATAADDDSVRAIVLTHTGNTFCAGADLAESAAEGGPAQGTQRLIRLLRGILSNPKPVIARIDGHVRAGGTGIVGACDIVLVGSATTFAFTEVRIGVAPAMISLTTLPRMTDRAANRYLLTGEKFGPTEAVAMGLITETVAEPSGDRGVGALDDLLEQYLNNLRQCSPQGLAATKPLMTAHILAEFDAKADALAELSGSLFASEDGQEGIASFLERRPPRWVVQ